MPFLAPFFFASSCRCYFLCFLHSLSLSLSPRPTKPSSSVVSFWPLFSLLQQSSLSSVCDRLIVCAFSSFFFFLLFLPVWSSQCSLLRLFHFFFIYLSCNFSRFHSSLSCCSFLCLLCFVWDSSISNGSCLWFSSSSSF